MFSVHHHLVRGDQFFFHQTIKSFSSVSWTDGHPLECAVDYTALLALVT